LFQENRPLPLDAGVLINHLLVLAGLTDDDIDLMESAPMDHWWRAMSREGNDLRIRETALYIFDQLTRSYS
jgi:hypothetical protein